VVDSDDVNLPNINLVAFPDHEDGNQEDVHEMITLLLGALDPPLPKRQDGKEHSLAEKSTPIQQIFAVTIKHLCECAYDSAATPDAITSTTVSDQCMTCEFVRVNYEDTTHLSLAIPGTAARSRKWYSWPKSDEVPVSMDSLFDKYFKDETIDFECGRWVGVLLQLYAMCS